MQQKLHEVQELTGLIWQTFVAAEELFQSLAKMKVNVDRLNAYIQGVYPLTQKQQKAKVRPTRWKSIAELFEIGDSPIFPPSHTLWGAYNAVTRYEDYRRANEGGADRRLNRVWFGQGADVKLRALSVADRLLRQWAN
jgi:hypothetical protein